MFIDELKNVVSQEILTAADILKAGSPQGYEYLRSTLNHALFFAHEDKTIFYLQHLLGTIRPDVISTIAQENKTILPEIGTKLEIIGKSLAEGKENQILDLTTETGLLIEKAWRKTLKNPKRSTGGLTPLLRFGQIE